MASSVIIEEKELTNTDVINSLKNLEALIKNNYTNLDNKISDLKKDVREDINELKELNKHLQERQQNDHDDIIKTARDMENLARDVESYKAHEEAIGKASSAKMHHIENKVNTLSVGTGKLLGIATGVGAVMGVIFGIIFFILDKY